MLMTLLILFCVLLSIYLLFLKEILEFLSIRLHYFRSFMHRNSGVFTLFFVILFFTEQILLLIFVYSLDVESKAQLLIGIFALIVLTTATLEKFILEKKYQYLQREAAKLAYDNEQNLKEMKRLYDEWKKLG